MLSKGMHLPMTTLLMEQERYDCQYSAYGYESHIDLNSFEQAKSYIQTAPYCIHLEYAKYPDYLSIRLNTEVVKLDTVLETLRSVCEKHGKVFRVAIK